MIALNKLREYLLDHLQKEEAGTSKYHLIHLLIGEMPRISNAQQYILCLETLLKEHKDLVAKVCKTIEHSYLWDVWGYYPLERIEGPYPREKAYERMKALNDLPTHDGQKRPHIIVIVGSDQEDRFQTIVARRRIQQELFL